jgi:hypothetical protein
LGILPRNAELTATEFFSCRPVFVIEDDDNNTEKMVRGVVGCVEVVAGAQKRATNVASSVSTGMHLAQCNEENEDHSQKKMALI